MTLAGKNIHSRNSSSVDPTRAAVQVTVGGPDIAMSATFQCGYCRRVVAQAAGTVFIQRQDDSAPISYAVTAGYAIEGLITLIGGTTTHGTASTIALNLEV